MRVKFCPQCSSPDIGYFAGGVSGTYRCSKCGYVGTLIMEKEFIKKS